MTERDFIYWLKGYLSAKPDSSTKGDILYMLNQIEENKVRLTGTLSEPYKDTIKWANKNSEIWFENKFKIDGSANGLP